MSELRIPPILADMLGFQIRIAQLRFFEEFYQTFSENYATPAEYSMLVLVSQQPGIRQGVLASRLHIKRSNMTKLMRNLSARGLVERRSPKSDGRAYEIYLTASGDDLIARMTTMMPDHDADVASNLTAKERDKLLGLLKKLNGGSRRPRRVAATEGLTRG